MFHQTGKKVGLHTKPLAALTAITPGDRLIDTPKRTPLIKTIMTTGGLNPKVFKELCLQLMKNMLNYCQQLPESSHHYYALPGGLFDYALNRTEAALILFRDNLLVEPQAPLSDEQKQWWYALFSAALLRGMGKLYLDYDIELYDKNGVPVKKWDPLTEPLFPSSSHYGYVFDTSDDAVLRNNLNVLIARQIMPQEGFEWIASKKDILNTWLRLLNEDQDNMGALEAILDRAEAIAIQRDLIDIPLEQFDPKAKRNLNNTFIDKSQDPLLKKEQVLGIEFIQWLQHALENGTLILNQGPLHKVANGLLIGVEVFKLYLSGNPALNNWQTVQQGLVALGLHRIGDHGSPISRLKQGNGIVLKGSVGLPNQLFVQDNITNTKKKMTTISMLLEKNQEHLSNKGHWSTEKPTAGPSLMHKPPGAPHG